MRSAFAVAALAAGAAAVPYQKRAIVTDYDIVYETAYVTVTAGAEPVSVAAAAETSTVTQENNHYGHHSHGHGHGWSSKYTSTVEEEPTPTPEPEPTTPTSTYVAPATTEVVQAPEPTTEAPAPTQTYEAPTSQAPAPAPSSSETPAPAPAPTSEDAPAPASSTAAPVQAAPTSYSETVVVHHNVHRANHSADPLEWDDSLASCAAEIASSCEYAHNTVAQGGGYGQNIAAGIKGDQVSKVITDLFYNGEVNLYENLYGETTPDMSNFEGWGHFTQIVWKGTTKVGCATQDCSSQGLKNVGDTVPPYFTVCNYKTPGNYYGEYKDNVGVPLNETTVDWSLSPVYF